MSGAISAVSVAGATAAAAEGATTLGVASAAIGANAGLFGAIGTGLSALGSIQQGRAQSASANYNAQVQANNAQLEEQKATLAGQEGAANTAIEQQKTRAQVGAIKTAQAANGVNINTGSAVDVRSSAAELGELNALTVRSNAVKEAYGYKTQAASDTAQSQLDKQQAKYDSTAGYITAGSTLLSKGTSGSQTGLWDKQITKDALNTPTDVSGIY